MKKFLSQILVIVFVFVLFGCNTNTNQNDKENNKKEETKVEDVVLEIFKDSNSIEELDVFVGDSFALEYASSKIIRDTVVWESSSPNVATIDNYGKVEVLGKGTTVITVYLKNSPFISESIFLNATDKPIQTGVGSGLSKDDPVFLGEEGDAPLEIYFIEMQHIYADSLFIKKGNVEILIDSGYEYDGTFVDKVLTEHCADDRLDLLMLSHSDGDHIDGLERGLQNVDNVSLMIDYGGVGTGNVLKARNKYTELGMDYYSAYDCVNKVNGASDIIYLTEDFYFEVLNTGQYIKNTDTNAGNKSSVAVIFYYKNFSFFTAGDITTSTEEALLKNEDLPEVTLYKASHHGSHGSNSQELLDTLNPKAVAISAARANQYQVVPTGPQENKTYNLNAASGHPAAEAIERIYKAPNISQNLNVYWNAVNGTMKFTTYGNNDFTFTGSTPLKGYYDLTLTNGVGVWNDDINDFENKVTGEENFRLHETKVFVFRNYVQYLPQWAKDEYFS